MKIIIDTNAYSALLLKNIPLSELVLSSDVVYLSTIVLGELEYGFKKGSIYEKNKDLLKIFLSDTLVKIIDVSQETAIHFGTIHADLEKSGLRIPTNDIWIVAHAMQYKAKLVTFDKHFERVTGLDVWKP